MSWKKAGGINRSSIQQAANIPYLSSNYESNFEYVWANDVSINSTLFVGRSVGINAEPVKITTTSFVIRNEFTFSWRKYYSIWY